MTPVYACVSVRHAWDRTQFLSTNQLFMDIFNIHDRAAFPAQVESYFQDSNYKGVIHLAEERLAQSPHDVDATIALCHAWIKLGHLEKAMAALGEVEDKIMRLADIYLSLGEICRMAGLAEESLRYYKRFLAINPHSPKAARAREIMASANGSAEIKESQEEQVDHVLAPEFYTLTMADLYVSQGHLEMAEGVLEVIMTRDSEREAAIQRLNRIEEKRRSQMVLRLSQQNIRRVLDTLGRWLNNASRMKKEALVKNDLLKSPDAALP